MASILVFSGSTNFLINLSILLSILTYLPPSFSSSRFLSPLITRTLSSSTCTLISPDFSPGMSMMNTYEFGYSFTSAGVAAMALASQTRRPYFLRHYHHMLIKIVMEIICNRELNQIINAIGPLEASITYTKVGKPSQVGTKFGGALKLSIGRDEKSTLFTIRLIKGSDLIELQKNHDQHLEVGSTGYHDGVDDKKQVFEMAMLRCAMPIKKERHSLQRDGELLMSQPTKVSYYPVRKTRVSQNDKG
ncbi:hypothetical protein RJ640_023833 [Escallonia rubra]|uniref:Uncharacterized protein n=1 Tax=Escallonia rubra TaxID=112253 RepID=A0AA88S0A4_9ASTE|nr:hypothetical protein RJ640_023833 [Escallonia rubra]